MPKIDRAAYEAAKETNGGGIEQVLPGAYVVRIQAVRTEGDTRKEHWTCDKKQYVLLVYDIDEGKFAGKYSEDYFMGFDGPLEDRDYMHCHCLSWKNIGDLKKQLRCITESNPGFDALAAFEADKWGMFVGKRFGVVLDGEVDTNDKGYDRWKLKVGDVVTIKDVHDGTTREPRIEDNRTPDVVTGAGQYDDVPFFV